MFDKWINDPTDLIVDENYYEITAGAKTDYFIDPTSDFQVGNAPLYVKEAHDCCTLCCKIKPEFADTYNAGAIMLYVSDTNWVKFAFEMTDMGHTSVVSVVTNGTSDDSNGEVIAADVIWMKLTRHIDVIGLYYSLDGVIWKMVRLFKHPLKLDDKVYIGLEAQSPLGDKCKVSFMEVKYVDSSVNDLRKGI